MGRISEFILSPQVPLKQQDEKSLLEQLKLELKKDELNQKSITASQGRYMKCARGRCPQSANHLLIRIKRLTERHEENQLNVKTHDQKLNRIFVEKGRKKRMKILKAEVAEMKLQLNVASGKLHLTEIEDNYKKIAEHLSAQSEMEEQIKKADMEIAHLKSQFKRFDVKSVELSKETEAEGNKLN